MKFGLNDNQFSVILNIINKYPEIEKVVIFGSRATGTYTETSDIDLAFHIRLNNMQIKLKLINDFEESNLPFFVDVLDYNQIENQQLKMLIDENGITIFSK